MVAVPPLTATIQYRVPWVTVREGVRGTFVGPTDPGPTTSAHARTEDEGIPPESGRIVMLTVFMPLPRCRSRRVRLSRMYVVAGVKDWATLSLDQTRKKGSPIGTTVFES